MPEPIITMTDDGFRREVPHPASLGTGTSGQHKENPAGLRSSAAQKIIEAVKAGANHGFFPGTAFFGTYWILVRLMNSRKQRVPAEGESQPQPLTFAQKLLFMAQAFQAIASMIATVGILLGAGLSLLFGDRVSFITSLLLGVAVVTFFMLAIMWPERHKFKALLTDLANNPQRNPTM